MAFTNIKYVLIGICFLTTVYSQDNYNNGKRAPLGKCKHGSAGICGGFVNAKCPPGTTCQRIWPTPTAGVCCFNKPNKPESICPYGEDGICGGIAGLLCREGTTCTDTGAPPFPDSAGLCCINKPSKGQCPPPSTIMTHCAVIPGVNCGSDSECPGGRLCCPYGCGRVCMNPV